MMTALNPTLDRYRGCLLGLAVGDALGTTVEFLPPGSFEPLTDMVGGGAFNLAPGQWTDDTSMALCLAESLIRCKGFNPVDQIQRYLRWLREGYLSGYLSKRAPSASTPWPLLRWQRIKRHMHAVATTCIWRPALMPLIRR